MKTRLEQCVRRGLVSIFLVSMIVFAPAVAVAAPYAAVVMDARTGEILHARNADTRLHPASLTKMMTLYIVFEAIENGEITLDTQVRISRNAAAEPPSKLGLRAGQRIRLRYLIRAAAVKSANDAATALGEAVSGSEAAFVDRMNRTARALGMTRTTFRNANGLTARGHLSTARDMTTLGRRLFYDYPQYYNLFSRRSADAGVRKVNNTNRRLLDAYRGADGIKTGYTSAAGFNLVASAERGEERIIATVFGGRSSASRNAQVAELLDMGFQRAPTRVAVRRLPPPNYGANPPGRGTTTRIVTAVARSRRPSPRPNQAQPDALMLALQSEIQNAVEAARQDIRSDGTQRLSEAARIRPLRRPEPRAESAAVSSGEENLIASLEAEGPSDQGDQGAEFTLAAVQPGAITEAEPPVMEEVIILPEPRFEVQDPITVTRVSTSGGRLWGVNIGRFGSRYQAERVLLRTALREMSTLDGTLRRVVRQNSGFDANFVGMTQETAELACRRLVARGIDCSPIGPS